VWFFNWLVTDFLLTCVTDFFTDLWHIFYWLVTYFLLTCDIFFTDLWPTFYWLVTYFLLTCDIFSTDLWRVFYWLVTYFLPTCDIFFTDLWPTFLLTCESLTCVTDFYWLVTDFFYWLVTNLSLIFTDLTLSLPKCDVCDMGQDAFDVTSVTCMTWCNNIFFLCDNKCQSTWHDVTWCDNKLQMCDICDIIFNIIQE
jgi:hypothetical protein